MLRPALSLSPTPNLSPTGALPEFAEPPRRLNLKPNLKVSRPPLNLAPAPAVAPSAAAAFSSAPLATTALLATGFTLGLAIGDAIYKAVSDDPSLSDYLKSWLGSIGNQSSPQPSGDVETDGEEPPFYGGQMVGVGYTVTLTMSGGGIFVINWTGPISSITSEPLQSGARIFINGTQAQQSTLASRAHPITNINIVRSDGLPDTGGNLPGYGSGTATFNNPPSISPFSPIPASSPSSVPQGNPSFPPAPSAALVPNLLDSPIPLLGAAPLVSPTKTQPSEQTKTKTQAQPQRNDGKPPTAVVNACLCSPTVNAVDKLVNPAPTANNAGLASLLGLGGLAALIQQIANAIGITAFPISVPASINQCDLRPGKQLNNLAESQLWQVEQLDSVMGQWCNSIDIDTPEGKKTFEVKDMSDAVSEILGMLAAQSINSGITQNAVIRNLIETGATKQQAFLAHQYSKGNAEFLGYEGQRQKTNMPLTFTPGKDLLKGLLGHGNIPVQGWKNTSTRDLGDVLNELLQAAAIIRAVYWRRLNPKGDMEGQLKDIIGRQANFSDRVRQDEENNPDGDDWARYIEAVENAFGVDQANPYGRDISQRPKIVNKQPPEGLE